jgi:hypothetical protein
MKIAIGTPIHECKEYCIYEWLDNVKRVNPQVDYIFLSDNSNTEEFFERVKKYTEQIGLVCIFNYQQDMESHEDEYRRMHSREWIREKIIESGADVWLSWECDIIVEDGALEKLVPFLQQFDIITSTYPNRGEDPDKSMGGGIGFALIQLAGGGWVRPLQ